MATHKSALKRHRQNQKRQARNRAVRARLRGVVKQVRHSIDAGATADAEATLRTAERFLDKAVSKGVVHRNTASRTVARLSGRLHASR